MFLDHLGHEEGLARQTVSAYLSNVKHHYTTELSLFGPPSSVWGPKGSRHPLITLTLNAIPRHERPPRMFLSHKWIKDGFDHCWSTTEYVAIAFLYGWILRVGEGCKPLESHIITWSMVTFYVSDLDGERSVLPMADLRTRPCDMVEVHLHSRKCQEEARRLPGRINTCHLADPSKGTTTWCGLCMPTLLQGWAIDNNIDRLSSATVDKRPVLAIPGTNQVVSPSMISKALRRNAHRRGEDEKSVVPHCLRHTPITQLANSSVADNPPLLLLATGHKSVESTDPYINPGHYMAERISAELQDPFPATRARK